MMQWKNERKSDSITDTFLNTFIYRRTDATEDTQEKEPPCAGIRTHSISIQLSSLQL